jgi:hypothetical protein
MLISALSRPRYDTETLQVVALATSWMRVPAQRHLFNRVTLFTGIHAYRLLNVLDFNAGFADHIRSLCVIEGDGENVRRLAELLMRVRLRYD